MITIHIILNLTLVILHSYLANKQKNAENVVSAVLWACVLGLNIALW